MTAPPRPSSVAVLGLGAMGRRMARRLLDVGVPLAVWNRTPDAADALVADGARRATSPRDAAQGAAAVLSVVTDDAASRAVWTGPDGALAGLAADAVAVESSTLTPAWVAGWAGLVGAPAPPRSTRPSSGRGRRPRRGGSRSSSAATRPRWAASGRVRPLLDAMGGAVHACGPTGSGAALKLAVNALFAAQVAQAAEALAFARALGVEGAADVLAALPVTSPASAGAIAAIGAGAFDPLFPVDLLAKDLRYATETAARAGVDAPLASAARAVFERARDAGLGGLNVTGVARLYGLG